MIQGKSNIVLIGMAGCGKSTVGKMLAAKLNRSFVDTDELIVEYQRRPLQQIIDSEGSEKFRRIEEEVLLKINVSNHVIATGGSSIYSSKGIDHLKECGVIILLQTDLEVLKKRVGDSSGRGLVKSTKQSFEDLYEERRLLYECSSEITIECSSLSLEDVCDTIIERLQ